MDEGLLDGVYAHDYFLNLILLNPIFLECLDD
jgi:hypothetical protein